MSQLALPIIHLPDHSFDNFVSDSNEIVSAFLKEKITAISAQDEAVDIVYLHNKDAVGKTHLLHSCCRFSEQHNLPCVYLDSQFLAEMPPEVVHGIEENAVICIDNLQAFANSDNWQVAVFDLINKLRESKSKLIVFAADKKPDSVGFGLPDLVSRLNWGTRFKLKNYSDDDKLEILTSHAGERGFTLPVHCARYVLKTCSRDLHQLIDIVDVIDNFSLQEKRFMTIPLLKRALDQVS